MPDKFDLSKLPDPIDLSGLPDNDVKPNQVQNNNDQNQQHPLSFLDSFSDATSNFLKNHPFIKRAFLGPSAEDEKANKDFITSHLSGDAKTSAENDPNTGKVVGPGLSKFPGVESIAGKIKNAGINTGNYYGGALSSILGDIVSGASTGFDPRTAGIKFVPTIDPLKVAQQVQFTKDARGVMGLDAPKQPLGLPAYNPPPEPVKPSFIAGDSGTIVPNKPQVIPNGNIVDPDVIARTDVGINPDANLPASKFNTDELMEQQRKDNLNYTAAEQYPGSRMVINDKALPNPAESGDVRGGFDAQTQPDKSLGYPLDIVPNSLRPRTTQSDLLNLSERQFIPNRPDLAPVGGEGEFNLVNRTAPEPLKNPVDLGTDAVYKKGEELQTGGESAPTAVFKGYQPDENGGQFPIYDIKGGPRNGSTVSAETLDKLGIDVPETPKVDSGGPQLNGDQIRQQILDRRKANSEAAIRDADSAAIANQPSLMEPHSMLGQVPSELSLDNGFKPSIDQINSSPIRSSNVSDAVIPKPSQAVPPKDIGAFQANFESPHKLLLKNDATRPVVEPILKANDEGAQWEASMMREAAEITRGLKKADRTRLSALMEHGTDDPAWNARNLISSDLINRANQAKRLTDSIYDMLPEGSSTKGGDDIGYWENYFTHIMKQPEGIGNQVKAIFDHNFGSESPLKKLFEQKEISDTEGNGSIGDLYEKGKGNPSSPYVEQREGMNPADMEWDYNKVMPTYISSMRKILFDKPAIEQASEALKSVPADTNMKELAQWYIQNYSGYDAQKGLHQAFNGVADQIARTTARSVISFNPGLHMLHIGEIPANIFPELGAKYTAQGVMDVVKSPFKTYSDMARMGMLQGEIKPFAFKTPMERFDSAGYFLSSVEAMVKGAAFNGAKRKFLAEGMEPAQAEIQAMRMAKDLSMTVDKARQMKGLSPESNYMGGEIGSKLGGQFKGIPLKIVEQYKDIATGLKEDPKSAQAWAKMARMLIGGGAAAGGTYETGVKLFHVHPTSLFPAAALGPAAPMLGKIALDVIGGNWQKAAFDTAAWAIPGGNNLKQILPQPDKTPNPNKGKMKLKFVQPSL